MVQNQSGFGGLQIILGIVVVAVLATIAVPKYRAYVNKAKLAEAFTLAGDTKRKLTEFYMSYNRFPKTDAEAAVVKTSTMSAPEFVKEIIVNHSDKANDVVIEIYMKDGLIPNETVETQYIYLAGNLSASSSYSVDWTCGSHGIDHELLPADCQN
jgi:Tfp pilus assembly protein PilE